MLDDELNTAIDDVARQMTEGSPAAGFRRGVVARIESGDAPRRSWRAAFVLSPLAAAAAIVVALFVARERAPLPAAPAPTATVRLKPDTTDRAAALVKSAVPDPVRLPPAPLRGVGGTRKADTTDVVRLKPDTADRALQLERLDVAPLTVGSLIPDSIQIEQLGAIAPMAIAPLEITDEPKER